MVHTVHTIHIVDIQNKFNGTIDTHPRKGSVMSSLLGGIHTLGMEKGTDTDLLGKQKSVNKETSTARLCLL